MTQAAAFLAGAAAVFFAGLMLFQRSLYSAAVCLLAVLLQAAVLFFLSGTSLVAFMQVMVYAGAVMVLVVVAVMVTAGRGPRWGDLSLPKPLVLGALALVLAELFLVFSGGTPAPGPGAPAGLDARIGPVLFGPYALATEAVTLLLFLSSLAVIGRREGAR